MTDVKISKFLKGLRASENLNTKNGRSKEEQLSRVEAQNYDDWQYEEETLSKTI